MLHFFQHHHFIPGPDLPTPMDHHCSIRVNTTHIFVSGGLNGVDDLRTAYLLNWLTRKWTPLPDMTYPRYGHSCGFASDPDRVVAVGGVTGAASTMATSEILDLATLEWTAGPGVPAKDYLTYSQSVPHLGSFLLVDGWGDEYNNDREYLEAIYEYNRPTDGWRRRQERPVKRRAEHIAFKVPDDVLNC